MAERVTLMLTEVGPCAAVQTPGPASEAEPKREVLRFILHHLLLLSGAAWAPNREYGAGVARFIRHHLVPGFTLPHLFLSRPAFPLHLSGAATASLHHRPLCLGVTV